MANYTALLMYSKDAQRNSEESPLKLLFNKIIYVILYTVTDHLRPSGLQIDGFK